MTDPRLDRLQWFDEQSRAYPVRQSPRAAGKKPRSYTWSCAPLLDQGREGACVGFAWAHEAASRPAPVVTGVTEQWARESVYWPAQQIDPWEGGAYPGAEPRYEGTAILAGAKVMQSKGAFAEYRWAFSITDVALGVGYEGPGVLGIDWHDGMLEPDERGFIHPTGDVVGGHAILVRGVSVSKRRFLLHNSWGWDWGGNGDAPPGGAWITWDDLAALLAQGGEACFPVRRRKFVP